MLTLNQIVTRLLDKAADDMTRPQALRYYNQVVSTLEAASLDDGALTRQQRESLARIAGSLCAEFGF